MKIKIIGTTGDPWAAALKNALPKTSSKKVAVLCGAAVQIWCTPLFWIARYRVLWLTGYEDFSGIVKRLIRIMSRLTHAILAPNQAIEAQYLKIGIPGDKLSLIYPPCEPNNSRAASQDAFVVGCDAETDFDHGLGALIRAIKEANDILGNARLLIGGTAADKSRIEWMAKELNIKHAVRVVPSREYDWVGQCHVFAFLRKPGSTPSLALIHALSQGLPIICNDAL
ncbi:MAG: hypothetical protein Q8P78_02100, partial [bacterium]|nr:hypothetical protein [bacterium]